MFGIYWFHDWIAYNMHIIEPQTVTFLLGSDGSSSAMPLLLCIPWFSLDIIQYYRQIEEIMRIGIHYPIFIVNQWNVIRVQCAFVWISFKPISYGCKKIIVAQHVSCEIYVHYMLNIQDIRIRIWACIELMSRLHVLSSSYVEDKRFDKTFSPYSKSCEFIDLLLCG